MSELSVHLSDLKLSYVSAGIVKIGLGICLSDDYTEFMKVAADIDIDIASSGANGLDEGSETPDTWYYVWLIKNMTSGEVAGLLSTSSVAPVMPEGYTKKRRIGVVRNDASSNFLDFRMEGQRVRHYYYRQDISALRLLIGGNAVDWTPVDCAALIPPVSTLGYFEFAQTSLGCTAWFGINGLSLQMRFVKDCSVSVGWLETDSHQQIEYKCNLASALAYLDVLGFSDEV